MESSEIQLMAMPKILITNPSSVVAPHLLVTLTLMESFLWTQKSKSLSARFKSFTKKKSLIRKLQMN
jgi:hypothetical protein